MSYELIKGQPPEKIRYFFKCLVEAKEVTYVDQQSDGKFVNVSEILVFLIPRESTQLLKFYATWLPDTDQDAQELGCEFPCLAGSVARVALWRRTQHVNNYHMLVMTKSVEELLKAKNGQVIDIEIMGEDEEQSLDAQRDYDLPYKKRYDDVSTDQADSLD